MKRGRPTKLTPEIQQAITDAVRVGSSVSSAAERVEVDRATVSIWISRGEGRLGDRLKTQPYINFANAIKKARADDQIRRIGRIEKAGQGGAVVYRRTVTKPSGEVVTEERYAEPQWTADAWHLERSDPDNWGRRERVEHTGKDGEPLPIPVIRIVQAPERVSLNGDSH